MATNIDYKFKSFRIKATEQVFHAILFVMLQKVIQTESMWMKPLCVTIKIKAIELFFQVMLFNHYAVQCMYNSKRTDHDRTCSSNRYLIAVTVHQLDA